MVSARLTILLVSSALLAGCVSSQSFLDPGYASTRYEDLAKRTEPLKLRLSVEFQRNGESFPRAEGLLRDGAERVLRASGLIVPVSEGGDGDIRIVMNNIADLDAARAKGFGTGLTLGISGTTVTDAYEMRVSVTRRGVTSATTGKHALHTAIGNTTVPAGLQTMPIDQAFNRVLEQMLLAALRDLQKEGQLSSATGTRWSFLRDLVGG
jgi:hypothetical protein